MDEPGLDDIRDAADLIEGAVIRTPFLPAPKLDELTGARVHVKYENMQVTNSFKERGALVKLSSLTEDQRRRGVIAMSAGNHAQAVAYHARRLGVPVTIVMPQATPYVKVAATRGYGARVVLHGEILGEAREEAMRIAEREGFTFVHPYDDFHVIRGQGTIALEMLTEDPGLDVIVVPVGGGGLISGVAAAAKGMKPQISVVGAETLLYPGMWSALRGEPAHCGGATLAEGIAVKSVGTLTLAMTRRLVDDMVLVEEAEIERAVDAYLTLQKTMAEGAGAAGLAALLAAPERFRGQTVGLILTGGNIDARILASIMMRQLARSQRIVAIRVTISDRPGMLGQIAAAIGALGGNILEVSHHRIFLDVPARGASIDITMETRGAAHASEIIAGLKARKIEVTRITAAAEELG